MNAFIEQHREDINSICRRFQVCKLEVFGSAANEKFDSETSDIDLVISFFPLPPAQYHDQYFAVLDAFEHLFNRHVDLIMASAITNPVFLKNINPDRTILFPPQQ